MAYGLGSQEVVLALLLIKAVLAFLAVLLFAHYKLAWERAKRHVPVHYFFAKWRAVRHAVFLGFAAIGFALGFSIELLGVEYGLSPNLARAASSVFEIGSLLLMLYVFFTLALEDVPAFQHISESARRNHHRAAAPPEEARRPQPAAARVKKARPKKRKRGRK